MGGMRGEVRTNQPDHRSVLFGAKTQWAKHPICMDVTFDSKYLRDVCCNDASMKACFGAEAAQAIKELLDDLVAAANLEEIGKMYFIDRTHRLSNEHQILLRSALVIRVIPRDSGIRQKQLEFKDINRIKILGVNDREDQQ
jgi:hypothetical protein